MLPILLSVQRALILIMMVKTETELNSNIENAPFFHKLTL